MAGSRQTNVWDAGGGTPMVLQETNREDLLRFSSNPNDTAVYRTRSEYTYVYGLGLVSVTDGQGNQRYALPDALGSVRTLSNGADGSPYATYSYDANGNLTGRTPGGGPTDIFMYDHENRLTQSVIGGVTSSSTYNGDGLRMSHTVSGQTATYTWDVAASLPVVLQDNTYTYVYGLDLISATDSGGNQNYYMYNGLGSVTNIVDYNGNEKALYFYDAFGNPRYAVELTSNVWRYTGEQRDADSGMYYLRARYYDPSTGRFLSQDPAGAGHPYAYVENNPVNFIDPSGLCHQELGYDQICGHWAHKEGDNFGSGAIYELVVLPGYGIAKVCVAYCDDAIDAVSDAAHKACSWLTLCAAKGRYAGDPRTAGQIIADDKKGSINREFPSQWRDRTYDEIKRAADAGDATAKEAKKLLDRKDYDKSTSPRTPAPSTSPR